MSDDQQLQRIKDSLRQYADFPKKGILFYDFLPLLGNAELRRDLIQAFISRITVKNERIDAIFGLESRGFLIAPLVADKLGLPFITIRKKGKLPGEVSSKSYSLEYGVDTIEVQLDALKNFKGLNCVIVDDLIATGGTMAAAEQLLTENGCNVVLNIVLIELSALDGIKKLSSPFESLIQL